MPGTVSAISVSYTHLTENVSAVRFISKEEGLDSWVQSMSGVAENSEELFAPLYEDNIMPDSFSVTIRDLSQLVTTVQGLSDYDDVDLSLIHI